MDILSVAAIRVPCSRCGGPYTVPLRDILLSHEAIHEGCPVTEETECPPLFQSRLASESAVMALDQAWRRLERQAVADGGELILIDRNAQRPAEVKTTRESSEHQSLVAQPRLKLSI